MRTPAPAKPGRRSPVVSRVVGPTQNGGAVNDEPKASELTCLEAALARAASTVALPVDRLASCEMELRVQLFEQGRHRKVMPVGNLDSMDDTVSLYVQTFMGELPRASTIRQRAKSSFSSKLRRSRSTQRARTSTQRARTSTQRARTSIQRARTAARAATRRLVQCWHLLPRCWSWWPSAFIPTLTALDNTATPVAVQAPRKTVALVRVPMHDDSTRLELAPAESTIHTMGQPTLPDSPRR